MSCLAGATCSPSASVRSSNTKSRRTSKTSAAEVFEVLRDFVFELRTEADGEQVAPAKQLIARHEIQTGAVVIRIERRNALAEVGLEKASLLHVAVKPEQPRVDFMAVVS